MSFCISFRLSGRLLKGFTPIEFIIALSIFAILAGVAIPVYVKFEVVPSCTQIKI